MIWYLKGVSASGKSFWANVIEKETSACYLSSDKIAEEVFGIKDGKNGPEVFKELNRQAIVALENKKDIIVDATNLGYKKQLFWMDCAKKFNTNIVCVYFNLCEVDFKYNLKKRHEGKWNFMSLEEVYHIAYGQKKFLQAPCEKDFYKIIEVKKNFTYNEIAHEIHSIIS